MQAKNVLVIGAVGVGGYFLWRLLVKQYAGGMWPTTSLPQTPGVPTPTVPTPIPPTPSNQLTAFKCQTGQGDPTQRARFWYDGKKRRGEAITLAAITGFLTSVPKGCRQATADALFQLHRYADVWTALGYAGCPTQWGNFTYC